MKKLISWTISSAAAALLVSTMSFAQPPPAAPETIPAPDTATVVAPAPAEPAPAGTTTTVTCYASQNNQVHRCKNETCRFSGLFTCLVLDM